MKKVIKITNVFLLIILLAAVMTGCASKDESTQSPRSSGNTTAIEDGIQSITTKLSAGAYPAITVQKGIPVQWTIQAGANDINGCNNKILIPEYNISKKLIAGDNVIEFTPDESKTVSFSCWMGMIRSTITVVDDINNIQTQEQDDTAAAESGPGSPGGCCAQ